MACRHHDVRVFDNFRCCLACGEAVFESTPDLGLTPQHADRVVYQYSKLNYELGQEIRLIKLFAGSSSDDIVLDIFHVNLTDEPPYEAISYPWATSTGDCSLSETVQCRGRYIAVTKHCKAALQCFRRQGRNRHLWIDAISIDQGNITERNHQVGFMGNIYSKASQVLIYLGSGTKATDRVLDYLNGKGFERDRLERDVREFLQQRWLDRVWVLQEIASAQLATMTAGSRTTQWTSISVNKVLELCAIVHLDPPSVLRWLPASEPEADILAVLQKSRNCSSTDRRDKIFAVLGLVHSNFQTTFPIDYSMTWQELYTKLAVHLIEKRNNLAVIKHMTGQSLESEALLPSWVPRWDVQLQYIPLSPVFGNDQLEVMNKVWFPDTEDFRVDEKAVQEYYELFLKQLQDQSSEGDLSSKTDSIVSTEALRQWLQLQSEQPLNSIYLRELTLALTQTHAKKFHVAICQRDARSTCQTLNDWQHVHGSAPDSLFSKWPCLRVRAHRLDSIRAYIGFRSVDDIHRIHRITSHATGRFRCCADCSPHFVKTPLCRKDPSIARTMLEEFSNEMRDTGRAPDYEQFLLQTDNSIGFSRFSIYSQANVLDHEIWLLDGLDVPFILWKRGQHYVCIGECYLHRATKHHLCVCCGCEVDPWRITTEIIDIW